VAPGFDGPFDDVVAEQAAAVHSSSELRGDIFVKTKMCKFNLLGVCSKGPTCVFAHSSNELNPTPDLFRTKLCKTLINTGCCNDPDCKYAHNRDELRSTNCVARGARSSSDASVIDEINTRSKYATGRSKFEYVSSAITSSQNEAVSFLPPGEVAVSSLTAPQGTTRGSGGARRGKRGRGSGGAASAMKPGKVEGVEPQNALQQPMRFGSLLFPEQLSATDTPTANQRQRRSKKKQDDAIAAHESLSPGHKQRPDSSPSTSSFEGLQGSYDGSSCGRERGGSTVSTAWSTSAGSSIVTAPGNVATERPFEGATYTTTAVEGFDTSSWFQAESSVAVMQDAFDDNDDESDSSKALRLDELIRGGTVTVKNTFLDFEPNRQFGLRTVHTASGRLEEMAQEQEAP
jgi:hypothetical protein